MAFHRQTARSQRNPANRRYTFTDAPIPMSGGGISTVNLTMPPDWTGRDMVDLVGQLVEQGNAKLFYGAIEPTPRHLGNVSDEIVPMASEDEPMPPSAWAKAKARVADQANLPASVPAMPDNAPSNSVTRGGMAGPGMMGTPVASFPTNGGQLQYYMVTKPDGLCVIKRDQSNGFSEVAGRYPPLGGSAYYSADVSTTQWRLFRTGRQQVDLNRPGIQAGRANARLANDAASRINAINRRNREVHGRPRP